MNKKIDLVELSNDPASLLSLRPNDPVLIKLETYRLYRAGYSVTEIANTFEITRSYLYEMWQHFEEKGTITFINKNWGTIPTKLTTDLEAAIIRAKALSPKRKDNDLAKEFGVDRITVYRLLKEHGIQDLHKVIHNRK